VGAIAPSELQRQVDTSFLFRGSNLLDLKMGKRGRMSSTRGAFQATERVLVSPLAARERAVQRELMWTQTASENWNGVSIERAVSYER
jgi:hypothetical protein